MADVMTPVQRSRCMSRIRAKDTSPELRLRRALWGAGLRYRLRLKQPLPGKPDVIFKRAAVAVFVDGCFWHSCPDHGHVPKSNQAYWIPKLQGVAQRDRRATAALESGGWTVLRFWEHELEEDLEAVVARVAESVQEGEDSATG